MVDPTEPVIEEHVVQVVLGPNGQMIAVEDSRPAVIRVEGEAVEVLVQVLSAVGLVGQNGSRLVQYRLRCPHCGTEQPWNLYAQADLPPSLECPACEDAYSTAPMRVGALFAQLPPTTPEQG